ncbi:MAG: citryl-CoA lyase [Thermoplasmata archaeon]|nr:MAG: citryl-CoA lyase [Thermoplasmata archaeon]
MEPVKWKTGITKVEPNNIVTRGYPQDELIGNVPFAHVVFLLLKGEMPEEKEGKMMDAILTACVDHGVTPPSSQAARVVASGGVPMPTAIAAGLMSIGDFHGGAIEKGALFLQDGVKRMVEEGKNPEEMAAELVAESREKKQRILGFGHRIHSDDPRTKKLLSLADELGIAGDHTALSRAIQIELEKALDRKMPINVDGCVAALISDMGFDWRLGKAFFLIGRAAGLTAQVYEEVSREKPMRRMWSAEVDYDGPGGK